MSKRRDYNPNAPFQTFAEATRTTGLSTYFLRTGCKNGTIPHIKSGNTYLVNVPAMLQRLNVESEKAAPGNPAA